MSRASAVLLLLLAVPAGASDSNMRNPHGDPGMCGNCHLDGTPEEPGPPMPVVQTCRGCHPTADMHPVGMAPDEIRVADGWPLENGLVTCATCHAEPAHGEPYAALPSPWHRGGPYDTRTQFCFSCHREDAYVRSNPHHPATPRDDADPTCSACHMTRPAPGALVADARLRLAGDKVCHTCHPDEAHLGVADHVGLRVTETLPAELALDDGRIACWTCHEMHDGGAAGTVHGKLGQRLVDHSRTREWGSVPHTATWPGQGEDALLALPLQGDALCNACHGEGP